MTVQAQALACGSTSLNLRVEGQLFKRILGHFQVHP